MSVSETSMNAILETLGKEIDEGRKNKEALKALFERIVNDHINTEGAIWGLDRESTQHLIELTGLNAIGNVPLMLYLFQGNKDIV